MAQTSSISDPRRTFIASYAKDKLADKAGLGPFSTNGPFLQTAPAAKRTKGGLRTFATIAKCTSGIVDSRRWLCEAFVLACGLVVKMEQKMKQNAAAINALDEYALIEKPKYAFMVEAPWGSGKTHLVRQKFKDELSDGLARYATLNGVKDRKAFRRALLAETSDAKIADAVGKLGNTLGFFAKFGNVGTIVQDAVEDRMIGNLPKIIIFDDVERCEMSPAELLGLINEFVEHNSKNVVLCAYIERDEGTDEAKTKRELFLTLKEKVVGRTVRIVADIGNALPEFVAAMPEGHGKQWFKSNVKLVLELFTEAKHSNLRVMRQCLHDCGRVIDILDEDLRVTTDAMHRFVRTYFALSMAIATGRLNSMQLADRGNHRCIVKPENEEKPHPLYTCYEVHPQAEIFAGNAASILPTELGISLIGIGYEEPETINAALRATKQFSGSHEISLWRRFVEWRLMPTDELKSTHEEAMSYVFDEDDIEPGPYLHMAHDLITIAEDGGGSGKEIAKKIEGRIKTLSESGMIPASTYGVDYGWSTERGFSFGGFSYELTEIVKPLIDAMRTAQLEAFTTTTTEEAERILDLLAKDLEAFDREFSGRSGHVGYYHTEILHLIDPHKFAEVSYGHIASGQFEAIGSVLKALADRCRNLESNEKEAAWANKVREALCNIATESGPLEKARMHWFLGFHWRFPKDAESD
jgi:hypothetical protein